MGVARGIASVVGAIARPVVAPFFGTAAELPREYTDAYPELARARWRRGGLPVRVGGWCLGQSSVSAITLWRTIWIAPNIAPPVELLLHEFRHVQQFEADLTFPLRYLWQSLRHGYVNNRYEVDARAYAAARVREGPDLHPERMR